MLRASIAALGLSLLSLIALSCSDDDPAEPPAPKDLQLSDLLGVWHCVECVDPVNPGAGTAVEDSTLFISILPDSFMVVACRRDSLRWGNFYSTPDTMSITARGELTNQIDAVFTWTRIDSLDAHRMVITAFGNPVADDIRRKIPQEPACPAGP